ncbi:MAG: GNAT family N-acetyltransferase [Anaerolineales bacterium]|nr:GNAT family N-acetyltransferase [Anaerolineales bacterium]
MTLRIRPVRTWWERETFLTFPWRIYRNDPLWVPPLLSERRARIDPQRGLFFRDGYAEFFIAWQGRQAVGTIACAEDRTRTQALGRAECMIGFFECIQDYAVAEALFNHATEWARARHMVSLYGPYHLDREDGRGILIEGRDRPPVSYCGHNPLYYREFFERYGFQKYGEDGLAYLIEVNLDTPPVRRLLALAERVSQRKNILIRSGNLEDMEGEIDRILELQNRALAHFPDFTPYTRTAIEAMIRPALKVVDPDLVLFAEVNGQTVGWFPGIPDMNEVLIHLNGLRYPWDYLRLLQYAHFRPKTLTIKSVAVLPEYWDTGVGVLLFAEMARRAAAKGYRWVDLSLTGEENLDTYLLAHRIGARVYKRYRIYRKAL